VADKKVEGLAVENMHVCIFSESDWRSKSDSSGRFGISYNLSSLQDCDVILVAVKTVDTKAVGMALAHLLLPKKEDDDDDSTPIILSFQNGTRNAEWLREIFQKKYKKKNDDDGNDDDHHQTTTNIEILTSVVAFSAEWQRNNTTFHMNTPGHCILEHPTQIRNVPAILTLVQALKEGGISSHTTRDISGQKYAKLLVNLMNPINALSAMPIPIMLTKRGYRRVISAALREAVRVLRRTTTSGNSRPVLAVGVLVPLLLAFPDWVFAFLARGVSSPHYTSSMLQDLERGRVTEIDELCGEIVRLANHMKNDDDDDDDGQEETTTTTTTTTTTPINAALVRLVREAEEERMISRNGKDPITSTNSSTSCYGIHPNELLVQVGLHS
jgi:2-dehydropantoate 2-reductase